MMTMTANSRAQMAPAIGASIAMTVTPFILASVGAHVCRRDCARHCDGLREGMEP
jgi:hypothetical protein